MKAVKIHLTPEDLAALDAYAAAHGIRGLRAPGARAAAVRALIRASVPIPEVAASKPTTP